ncbi:MAG: tyrosine-type recombinase/integrase [Burkholderiales bacterium]
MPENTPETGPNLVVVPQGGLGFERFDHKKTAEFSERSLSEETRRAYRRVVGEFFDYFKHRHPSLITSKDILGWRDALRQAKKKAATIAFKLSVIRSLYEFLREKGIVTENPVGVKRVPPPKVPDDLRGRALSAEEVRRLLLAPDRTKPAGARDYTLMLLMLRTSIRVGEACALKLSDKSWNHGRWVLRVKVKGRSERTIPLPDVVREAIDEYLKLDRSRRQHLHSDGPDQFIFQPITNYRTLEFSKPLSTTHAWNIVRKWSSYCRFKEKVSPHDLRRTAITRALDQGLSYRQVQMMSGHRDPKTVMRYDHGRKNLELNAINFLSYEDPTERKS